jgi:2-octaprenyl-6-methoxyphenol hydroxylase
MSKAIIIGGGPIGLACALLMAQRSISSFVIDARPLEQARTDARLLALSRGTWEILTPILRHDLPPRAPIREVLVSSAGDFGSTRIAAADFAGVELGATVRYGELLAALAQAASTQPAIELMRPLAAVDVRQRPDHVEVVLGDGSSRSAELIVEAEGSPLSRGAAALAEAWALLADVRLRPANDEAPGGVAYERFTRQGPLALLPSPSVVAGASGRGYALVWCMDAAEARRRSQLTDALLVAELQAQLGAHIGHVSAIGPRRAAALPRRMRTQVHAHRRVAVGNAAQTLHPVAGQGFNLGLRDCATLADELAHGSAVMPALHRYAARRRADRAAIAMLTDNLPAIFSSRFAPLAIARGLGLALLDVAPALRREFAHLLMFGVRR